MHRFPTDPDITDPAASPIAAVGRHRRPDDEELQLVTIAEAAARLEVSRSKLYLLIADGELATVRIGRARRIDLADLRAFVERNRAA